MAKTEGKSKKTDMRQARYMNPLTDFGFKRIFGTEANKDLLIHFLESVLDIDGGIMDLHYDNAEKQGRIETDRKAIFDLHCTTGKGERIIIEMQNLNQKYFKDRVLYYATFPIQEQGEKGKEWDFELNSVYSVNIVNFRIGKNIPANKYVSFVQLLDKKTHQIFYDKLTFVFMELPRFNKKEHELLNDFDRWMYVLKHLSKLHDLPETLRNRVFEKLFHVAEILKLTPDERKSYDQSLKNYRDMYLIENELKNEIKKKESELKEQKTIIKKQDANLKELNVNLKELNVNFQKLHIDFQKQSVDLQKFSSAIKNTVRILLEAGVSVQKIADSTGLSIVEIGQIKTREEI